MSASTDVFGVINREGAYKVLIGLNPHFVRDYVTCNTCIINIIYCQEIYSLGKVK